MGHVPGNDPRGRTLRSSGVRTRVLWLVKGLGPGGAERLLVQHARLGHRDRFEYEVAYLLPWKEHLVPEFEAL